MLLLFLLLGSAVYGLRQALLPPPAPAPLPVLVRTDQLEHLRRELVQRLGRRPTPPELDRAVADLVDQELLFRAALALGLQHEDAVVARRLIANQRFLAESGRENGADGSPSDTALLREAFALGMEKTDLVVRRRLIERMRERIVSAAAAGAPSPERTTARAPAPGSAEPRVRLAQLYFSRDRRGEQTLADARAAREGLVREGSLPEAAGRLLIGDPLLLGQSLPASTERELAAALGPEFAATALALPLRTWSEPVASPYGVHLLYRGEWIESDARGREAPRGQTEMREAVPDEMRQEVREERRAEVLAGAAASIDRSVAQGTMLEHALVALRHGVVVLYEHESEAHTE